MPGAFVAGAGGGGPQDRDDAGNEVRGAGQHEGDGLVEAEGLDGGGEEVLEAVRGEVHVLHEGEEPQFRVLGCLFETGEWRRGCLATDGIALDAVVGELPFFFAEPAGVKWGVGERESSANGDEEGCNSLDDEEPAPACEAGGTIKTGEDAKGDEASEGGREDVPGIKNGDASSNLFARVED